VAAVIAPKLMHKTLMIATGAVTVGGSKLGDKVMPEELKDETMKREKVTKLGVLQERAKTELREFQLPETVATNEVFLTGACTIPRKGWAFTLSDGRVLYGNELPIYRYYELLGLNVAGRWFYWRRDFPSISSRN